MSVQNPEQIIELSDIDVLTMAQEAQTIEDEMVALSGIFKQFRHHSLLKDAEWQAAPNAETQIFATIAEAPTRIKESIRQSTTTADKKVPHKSVSTYRELEKRNTYNTDSLSRYLQEIGRIPLLKGADEERKLAQIIENGLAASKTIEERARELTEHELFTLNRTAQKGKRAKEKFFEANLRLVVSVAKRYPVVSGLELEDLIQEGNLGLEHAIDKFDWRKGFKFSTYATFWIRQSIGRAIDQKAYLIRLPGDKAASLRAAKRSQEVDHLSSEHASLQKMANIVHLEKPVGDDGSTVGDFVLSSDIGPEEKVVKEVAADRVTELLALLNPRERRAIELRFELTGEKRPSYRTIGQELGVTGEAARRIVKSAIGKLQNPVILRQLHEAFDS